MTGALWNTPSFGHSRQPDWTTPIAVYYDARTDDYYAKYTERRDSGDKPKSRLYRLGESLETVEKHGKPKFSSIETRDLINVPVNPSEKIVPRAVVDKLVTIHTPERVYGPFPLPDYKTSSGTMVKTTLTPLAVTGDVTIFAAIIAILSAPSLLASVANAH